MQAKFSVTAQIKIQFALVLLAASALSLITFSPNAIAQSIDTSHQNSQSTKEQIRSSTQPQACRWIIIGSIRIYKCN